jgi:hypothetical protein
MTSDERHDLDAAIGRAVRQGHVLTWREDIIAGAAQVRLATDSAEAQRALGELEGLLPFGVTVVVEPPEEQATCHCPATSEYDPPCPRHGVLGIGVTGR